MLSSQNEFDSVPSRPRLARNLDCLLCAHVATGLVRDRRRAYYHCAHCELIFADPTSHLVPEAEQTVYNQHKNSPSDQNYRRFLNQLAQPLLEQLSAGAQGLDYGCGPGPTLSRMFEEAGMTMQLYDPYFAPDTQALNCTYDFVTCTEVVEHFYEPAKDWARLASLLRPGGWLGVMTRFYESADRFDQWYYKNDPTHVCFYNLQTLQWIAAQIGLTIKHQAHNVVLFVKT